MNLIHYYGNYTFLKTLNDTSIPFFKAAHPTRWDRSVGPVGGCVSGVCGSRWSGGTVGLIQNPCLTQAKKKHAANQE